MTAEQEQARHLVDENLSIIWPLSYVCFSRCPPRCRLRHRGADLRGWENPSTGSRWLPWRRWRRQNTPRKTTVSWRGWTPPRRTGTDCVTRWEHLVKWVRMSCKNRIILTKVQKNKLSFTFIWSSVYCMFLLGEFLTEADPNHIHTHHADTQAHTHVHPMLGLTSVHLWLFDLTAAGAHQDPGSGSRPADSHGSHEVWGHLLSTPSLWCGQVTSSLSPVCLGEAHFPLVLHFCFLFLPLPVLAPLSPPVVSFPRRLLVCLSLSPCAVLCPQSSHVVVIVSCHLPTSWYLSTVLLLFTSPTGPAHCRQLSTSVKVCLLHQPQLYHSSCVYEFNWTICKI